MTDDSVNQRLAQLESRLADLREEVTKVTERQRMAINIASGIATVFLGLLAAEMLS